MSTSGGGGSKTSAPRRLHPSSARSNPSATSGSSSIPASRGETASRTPCSGRDPDRSTGSFRRAAGVRSTARPRSGPAIAARSGEQSSSVRAIGPAWSRVGAERDDPGQRDEPSRRLDGRRAAESGRDPQRACGVRSRRGRHHARSQRGSRASARPSGRAFEGPRVPDLVGRPADRELVRVQVAEEDHSCGSAGPTRRSRARARRSAGGSTPSAASPRRRRDP